MRLRTYFMIGLYQLMIPKSADTQCHSEKFNHSIVSDVKLNREKRYITFPKSTAFVLTLTGLKAIQVKEPPNWNLDLEFDMIWPIPQENSKKPLKSKRKKYSPLHRHKRELYANFESAINRMGLPGKACVLRTICEARTFLHPPGVSFVDDILRVILSHGQYSSGKFDIYDAAYGTEDCEMKYKCPMSFLYFFMNNDENGIQ